MYESPVTKIYGEIRDEIVQKDEEHLMAVVSQTVGYQVDKEELIKALEYDRQQYNIGFADALDKIREEINQDSVIDMSGSKFVLVSRVNQIIDKYKAESEG